MKLSKDFWIIQVFALLHAGVAFGCRLTGIADDLLLTLSGEDLSATFMRLR